MSGWLTPRGWRADARHQTVWSVPLHTVYGQCHFPRQSLFLLILSEEVPGRQDDLETKTAPGEGPAPFPRFLQARAQTYFCIRRRRPIRPIKLEPTSAMEMGSGITVVKLKLALKPPNGPSTISPPRTFGSPG